MAAKKANPAMDFIVEQLKKDRKVSYADVKAAADAKKLKIFPIMFGRAQALLGIVKMAPRGQGKAAKERTAASKAAAPAAKRGPQGRKNLGLGMDANALDGIIAAVRSSEQSKARYRAALEKIQQILGSALQG